MSVIGLRRDVFVLHSDDDREWVETYLADALTDADVTFELQSRLAFGTPLTIALEDAIATSDTQVLVISQATLGDYLGELATALTTHREMEVGDWSLIPFVLDSDAFHEMRLGVRMRNPIWAIEDWEEGVRQLVRLFDRELPLPPPIPKHGYRGLKTYQPEDMGLFFGRSREIDEMVYRIARRAFNVVAGPSGSGKSSLLRAGVIPRMSELDPDRRTWDTRTVVPGVDPLLSVLTALGADAGDGSQAGPQAATVAAASLLDGPVDEVLIFVDQVEQALPAAAAAADIFRALALLSHSEHVHIVLAIRDEFREDLYVTPVGALARNSEYTLQSLDDDGLRDAITGPARHVRVTVAASLVERLVADAGGQPGILPFVQETMIALWRHVRRGYLPYDAYHTLVGRASGAAGATGLRAALSNHADNVLAGLAAEKELVERILLRLVQFGEGRPNIRRQQTLAQLMAGPRENERAISEVVNRLAAEHSRLLTTSYRPQPAAGADVVIHDPERVGVDLAHDALLTDWSFLVELTSDQDRVSTELFRRDAERDAAAYGSGDRAYLWKGTRLRLGMSGARAHADDVSPAVTAFLRASRRWHLGQRMAAAGTFAVLVLIAGVVATTWWGERAAMQQAKGTDLIVMVDGIAIERYEVTNERYDACVQAGVCDRPGMARSGVAHDDPTRAGLPVVSIRATDAATFCEWIGRRLPNWDEWRSAATGGESRTWPWDDNALPSPDRVNAFFLESEELPPDLTMKQEDAVDLLILEETVTADDVADVATWLPRDTIQALVQSWSELTEEARAERLIGYSEAPIEDSDVIAVDALPQGATPDEPPIHQLLGNAGEWTTTIAHCGGSRAACRWDGVAAVDLRTTSSFASDPVALFDPHEVVSDEALDAMKGRDLRSC